MVDVRDVDQAISERVVDGEAIVFPVAAAAIRNAGFRDWLNAAKQGPEIKTVPLEPSTHSTEKFFAPLPSEEPS